MSQAPTGSLASFSYDLVGGMSGGIGRIVITGKNKRKCLCETSECVWHYQKPRKTRKVLPIALLAEIEQLFRTHNLWDITEAPLSELTALDAPTAHYSFDFGGDRYSFSSVYDYPEEVRTALSEIYALAVKPKEK